MIRYAILIELKADAPHGAAEAIVEKVRALPEQIPAIRELQAGTGLNEGNATLAIIALFDDLAGFDSYRASPAHLAVARDYLVPVVDRTTSIQFEI